TVLPLDLNRSELAFAASRFDRACKKKGIAGGLVRSAVVHASRFNVLLAQWGTKGAVLGHPLTDLIRANLDSFATTEPVWVVNDKHGGRNAYAPLLQDIIPEGFIVALEEGMRRSSYKAMGLAREVRFTFQPRADRGYLSVALASMISKYLREVFMIEFNR